MSSGDYFNHRESAKLAMVLAFKSVESKLDHLYAHVTQELENISSRLENVEKYVDFHAGAIEQIGKQVNNVKVIVDEVNDRCKDVKKLSNDSKNQFGELMKELKGYFVSQGIKNVKTSDKGVKEGQAVSKGSKQKDYNFKIGNRVIILNNYNPDHQFKAALVSKVSDHCVYLMLKESRESTSCAFKNVRLA